MALVLADRVKETTTTTGTGTVTLLGASTGFQSFAVIGNTNTTYYTIAGQTTSEWEVGIGTYTLAGTLLARTTVLANSAGTQPTALTFSAGTKDVFVTYPSSKSVNLDASGNATALGTPASGVLTNATGLPISTGVSGLGTDVATALAANANAAGGLTTIDGTATLTNKRITARVNVQTNVTPSPWAWDSTSYDQQEITALANALTISADANSTPTDGQKTIFRIQDNGTARVLTFTGGTARGFRPIGVNLTVSGANFTYTTTINKTAYFGCIYNSGDSRWDVVGIAQEA